jgi:HEAT repeat protein
LILGAVLCTSAWNAGADDKATADLIGALNSGDESVRLQAIDQLGARGGEAAVAPLAEMLKDNSAQIRAHAAGALGAIGAPAKGAVAALVELVKDEDPLVRRQAVQAVISIRPGPKVTVPLCVKLLEDADPGVRLRILSAISEAGPAAMPGLIEALSNDKAAYWACLVLRELGPAGKDAVPALIDRLEDPRPEIRREAVLALATMDSAAEPAVEPIAALLEDEQVATAATYALTRIGRIPSNAEKIIRRNVSSQDALLSTTSLWALAKVHPEDAALRRDATRRLITRLKDQDPFVRVQAARALSALPPAPEITASIWQEAIQDADETTIRYALDALAQLGAPAVPRLIAALEHEDLRLEVLYVLTRIGPAAAPATEALAKLVADPSEQVAHEAVLALAAIGPGAKQAVPDLLAQLEKGEDANSPAIVYALGKIDPSAASVQPALIKALNSDDPYLSLAGAWALAQADPPSEEIAAKAVPVLAAGLKLSFPVARQSAAEALSHFGPLAKTAVPALEAALEDEEPAVRDAAKQALAAIAAKRALK